MGNAWRTKFWILSSVGYFRLVSQVCFYRRKSLTRQCRSRDAFFESVSRSCRDCICESYKYKSSNMLCTCPSLGQNLRGGRKTWPLTVSKASSAKGILCCHTNFLVVQAAKDHDYMLDYSKKPRDVFVATGEREVDRLVTTSIIEADPHHFLDLDKVKTPSREPWEPKGKRRPIPDTRPSVLRRTGIQDFAHRILLAVVGGALLVGPMWLMVLHNSLYTGLVTTTVCVGIFGLFTSLALDKPLDVLSSTAAYAAVLVVFVGFQNSVNSS